jgi:hypothetical protein
MMESHRLSFALLVAALTAIILCTGRASMSQTSEQARPRFLGSYGNTQPSCELGAALSYLAAQLTTSVDDVAYVIVYRGYNNTGSFFHQPNPPGLFQRHSHALKNYLVKEKHFASERLEVIDGGMREQFRADMWLVPKGQTPPPPRADALPAMQETNQRRLFDEYLYDPESDMAEYFDPVARLDGFAKTLSSEPSAVGYIIGYAECLDVTEWRLADGNGTNEYVTREYQQSAPEGTGRKIAMAEKRRLLKLFGIDQSRVSVIDGGYKNSQMIELWIVPAGGEAPNPTPTVERRKPR